MMENHIMRAYGINEPGAYLMTYQAENYHPWCIGSRVYTEALRAHTSGSGVDLLAPHTYDSGVHPQKWFMGNEESAIHGQCGECSDFMTYQTTHLSVTTTGNGFPTEHLGTFDNEAELRSEISRNGEPGAEYWIVRHTDNDGEPIGNGYWLELDR